MHRIKVLNETVYRRTKEKGHIQFADSGRFKGGFRLRDKILHLTPTKRKTFEGWAVSATGKSRRKIFQALFPHGTEKGVPQLWLSND